MGWSGYVVRVGEAVVLVVVAALVLGQILGQPVLLSYVTTGSMTGTINPGDGFVAIPTQLAGPVHVGDIVTYQAEKLHNGGLTTHRIVGHTARGYITKGDANPFPDQSGVEPPVKPAQIKAVAWRPGGHVLVIPNFGTVVMAVKGTMAAIRRRIATLLGARSLLGPQGVAYLLFAASVVGYALDTFLDRKGGPERERERTRSDGVEARMIVLALVVVLLAVATAGMVLPGGQHEFGVVASNTNAPGLHVIRTGTTESTQYPVPNSGLLPTYVFLKAPDPAVTLSASRLTVGSRATRAVTLSVTAPAETGYYRYFLSEHRYLPLLPRSTVHALYAIHPWLPIGVEDLELGVPFYLFGTLLVGSGRIRRRDRERPTRSIATRIVGLLGGES